MAESNDDSVSNNCNQDSCNYDRLLSVFHSGTDVKRCLLDHFLRRKQLNLFDWLTNLDQNFLYFEDVQRAVRRTAVIQVTDLESSTINILLKNNCFLMFWDICLPNNSLEDILNYHKSELYSIYQKSSNNNQLSSLSTEHYSPSLTKSQWELLFKTDNKPEIDQEGDIHYISKDITLSSLNSDLNCILLYIICPLFKSVIVVSDCQIQITKIAVYSSVVQKPKFEDIWNKIVADIIQIGIYCNTSDYFRNKCETVRQTVFNRTLSQDNRKCILQDAFKNPGFIQVN